MNFSIENISSVKKKVSFEVPADRIDAEIDKVYGEIAKNASMPGFRKGKVPRSMVEKHFGDRMRDDVLRNIINETCYPTLYENKIYPVAAPTIECEGVRKGESLKYSATVEVVPEFEVTGYAGLVLTKEKFQPNQEEVEKRIDNLRSGMAELKPVERAVKKGDVVTMDFAGFIEGAPIANGAAEDFQLEIGSGRFIPGFEDEVVGMNAGEEKRFSLSFPENYNNAELAGKPADFQVTVKEVKMKELPEVDDDFARTIGGFDSAEELRNLLTDAYEKQERERIDVAIRDAAVNAVIEKNPIEIPEALVENQLRHMLESTKRRLAMQGVDVTKIGGEEEQFFNQYRPVAEMQVRGMLLLEAIARKEGIAVDDADFEQKFDQIAAEAGQPRENVANFYRSNAEARDGLAAKIREDKAIDLIVSRAEVTEEAA